MKRLFLIVVAIAFLASLVGVHEAFSLPTEITETVAQVNYQQQGRFDYIAYLKPSHLFGPDPQEPLPTPTNPKFPAEFIERIDMAFTYRFVPDKPVTKVSQQVEIKAVLGGEEVILIPTTTRTGDFTVNFSLDANQLALSPITTIQANVYATIETDTGRIFERFTQRLTMRSKGHLLEVDTNLASSQRSSWGDLSYEQIGDFDYFIRLKPDSPFGAITLKAPSGRPPPPPSPAKTVRPGELLFSKLIDKIDVTFYYEFKSDKPVQGLTTEVEINAILENPGVWSKEFVLVPPTEKSGDFSLSFPLDLDHFTETMESIHAEIGVPAGTHNLIIIADVHTVAQTDFGPINEVFSQTMSTTLGRGTLEWNKHLAQFKPGTIETTKMIANPNRYLGLSLSSVRILSAVMPVIFALLFAYLVWLNFKFKPVVVSPIEKEALRVRKKYGERMAQAISQTPVEGEKIISIGSMEDLIKVCDELGKPIIHQARTTPEEAHAYYVFDGVTRYQYSLDRGTA